MSLIFIPEETRVLLIGTSEYPSDNRFNSVKPIENNISTLAEIFKNPNIFNKIPDGNILPLLNKTSHEILEQLEEFGQKATDTFIVYYAGHGEREEGKTLYLTATNTKKDRLISTGIDFNRFNKAIQFSKAIKKIIILDCCYSGLATQSSDHSPLTEEELQDIHGTYIITSSPSNSVSYFLDNGKYTFFTAELVNILQEGINNQNPYIEIGDIYNEIKDKLDSKGYPVPTQKNTLNISNRIYFANNYRYIEYTTSINEADSLFRGNELDIALPKYHEIIQNFSSYNNESIHLKIQAIDLMKQSLSFFDEEKFETAYRILNESIDILKKTEFPISKIIEERHKIYGTVASRESALKKEIREYLIPIIRGEVEEDFLRNSDIVEEKLRSKVENEYNVKLINMEKTLREEIWEEYRENIPLDENIKDSLLILSANPKDTIRLRIDQEIREITSVFRGNKKFRVVSSLATRVTDLDTRFLDNSPLSYLHFAVHSTVEGIFFEDDNGKSIIVNGERLASLIEMFLDSLSTTCICTVVNGCYTAPVAYKLSKHIPFAIGFNGVIDDKTAVAFAKSFYQAIITKKDVVFAFEVAVRAIRLANTHDRFDAVLYRKEDYKESQPYTVNVEE